MFPWDWCETSASPRRRYVYARRITICCGNHENTVAGELTCLTSVLLHLSGTHHHLIGLLDLHFQVTFPDSSEIRWASYIARRFQCKTTYAILGGKDSTGPEDNSTD